MTHLGEGRLRTLLDGELSDSDAESARAHLDECDSCQALFTGLGEASTVVGVALRHLDTVAPPAGAKESVLARVGMGSGDAREARFTFARAAIIVLFFGAVVATALPASPVPWVVRRWLGSRRGALHGNGSRRKCRTAGGQCPLGPDTRVGRRSPRGGDRGAPRPTPGYRARDRAGCTLRGRISGRCVRRPAPRAFAPRRGVSRSLGARAGYASTFRGLWTWHPYRVNGRMYIRKAGDELDVAGPIVAQTPGEILLRVQ